MSDITDIPQRIYEDEVIVFIANRHDSTPQDIIRMFLAGSDAQPCLEDNEKEILRGLINMYKKNINIYN